MNGPLVDGDTLNVGAVSPNAKIVDKITWIEGEEWCRWNGALMSPEYMLKEFGHDGEIWMDKPDLLVIGGTLYCSDIQVLYDQLKDKDVDATSLLSEIRELKPWYEAMNIKLIPLREFQKDLDEYYADYQNRVRNNLF